MNNEHENMIASAMAMDNDELIKMHEIWSGTFAKLEDDLAKWREGEGLSEHAETPWDWQLEQARTKRDTLAAAILTRLQK